MDADGKAGDRVGAEMDLRLAALLSVNAMMVRFF
jgi:hypothetical protein